MHEPRCLDDLRVDGLDLDAVTRAIASGADTVPPSDLARTIRVEQDGAVRRLLPRVVPVAGSNPHQRGAVLLLYDVTDLVHLDEMRSELVAVASHELQTPLTTLRMTLLMLQEASDLLPGRQRELVATSLIGVEQLTETVHEFLDLTRIEAGELRLNLEPVHISLVIAEALRRVEGQAKAQSISLNARLDPDLPQISADPLRLRAVFDNILSNALKYTPAGGAVTVESQMVLLSGSNAPERVSISIADTGPGIPTGISFAGLRQVLPPRTPAVGGSSECARCRHRSVHVSSDRRVAWGAHRMFRRTDDSGSMHHRRTPGRRRTP